MSSSPIAVHCTPLLLLLVVVCVALLSSAVSAQSNITTAPTTTVVDVDTDGKFDLIFTEFQEEDTYHNNILTVLGSILNETTTPRCLFARSSGNLGHLFGNDVIVRFKILARSRTTQNTTAELQQLLLTTMEDPDLSDRLTNINVRQVIIVPATAKVPTFTVTTTWDLLYTMLILAGGLLVLGFIAVLSWKILLLLRRQSDDAKAARLEKEEAALALEEKKRLQAEADGSSASGGGSLLGDGIGGGRTGTWDMPDDEEMDIIKQLQAYRDDSAQHRGQQHQQQLNNGGTAGAGGGLLRVPEQHSRSCGGNYVQHPTVSDAKRAAIDRRMDIEFGLPEDQDVPVGMEQPPLGGDPLGGDQPNNSPPPAGSTIFPVVPQQHGMQGLGIQSAGPVPNMNSVSDFDRRMAHDPALRLPSRGLADDDLNL